MKKVEIYTDGACSGNPGEGGWGFILKYGVHEKSMSGYEKETTNNGFKRFKQLRRNKMHIKIYKNIRFQEI